MELTELTICGFCDFKSLIPKKTREHWRHCKKKRKLIRDMMIKG